MIGGGGGKCWCGKGEGGQRRRLISRVSTRIVQGGFPNAIVYVKPKKGSYYLWNLHSNLVSTSAHNNYVLHYLVQFVRPHQVLGKAFIKDSKLGDAEHNWSLGEFLSSNWLGFWAGREACHLGKWYLFWVFYEKQTTPAAASHVLEITTLLLLSPRSQAIKNSFTNNDFYKQCKRTQL